MNSTSNSINRTFLILTFACAIFISGAETQGASSSHKGGRLIIQRAPNFGNDLVVHLSIDGKKVADIPRDQRYDAPASAGRHVLTVVARPNAEHRPPISMHLTVQSGHTYILTAVWEADHGVVLRRSTKSNDTTTVPAVKR